MEVGAAELGALLGVSGRTITKWREIYKDFPEPLRKDGRAWVFDSKTTLVWWAKRFHAAPPPSGGYDITFEKARKSRADADRAEADAELARVQADLASGAVLDTQEALDSWIEVLAFTKARMRSIPAKVAPRLASEDRPAAVYDVLLREIDSALTELRDAQFEPLDSRPGVRPVDA